MSYLITIKLLVMKKKVFGKEIGSCGCEGDWQKSGNKHNFVYKDVGSNGTGYCNY